MFVAAGDSDPMILPHYSYLLAGLIPQARVKIYPDAAHGFLFQHHVEFSADVDAFLRAGSWTPIWAWTTLSIPDYSHAPAEGRRQGQSGRSPRWAARGRPHVRSSQRPLTFPT